MSKSLYINFRDNGFWAYDVPSSVFLKFLIDAASDRLASGIDLWLSDAIQQWRVTATIPDLSHYADDEWSRSQIDTVIGLCRTAVNVIRSGGDIAASEIATWPILDDQRIFMRGHDIVPCEAVARLGDAFMALLNDALPEPPETPLVVLHPRRESRYNCHARGYVMHRCGAEQSGEREPPMARVLKAFVLGRGPVTAIVRTSSIVVRNRQLRLIMQMIWRWRVSLLTRFVSPSQLGVRYSVHEQLGTGTSTATERLSIDGTLPLHPCRVAMASQPTMPKASLRHGQWLAMAFRSQATHGDEPLCASRVNRILFQDTTLGSVGWKAGFLRRRLPEHKIPRVDAVRRDETWTLAMQCRSQI